jgi:hypothetical protein
MEQGFIRRLLGMPADKREDLVEAKMDEACAALLESEEFARAANSTNAFNWGVEEYEIQEVEYDEDECVVTFSYSASGEEEDDFFCGNGVAGEAEAVIDADGRVTVREVTAEAFDRDDWDEEDLVY